MIAPRSQTVTNRFGVKGKTTVCFTQLRNALEQRDSGVYLDAFDICLLSDSILERSVCKILTELIMKVTVTPGIVIMCVNTSNTQRMSHKDVGQRDSHCGLRLAWTDMQGRMRKQERP